MATHIAVVEPQMEGPFHAPFNAALLHAVALAYPDAGVSFCAFPWHTDAIREILNQHAPDIAGRIEWSTLASTPAVALFARWRQSNDLIRKVLAADQRVLFSSISRMQLLQLKRILGRNSNLPVRAVLHGDLDQIEQPSTARFPQSLISYERVLLRPHPRSLRYILLGRSIQDNIPPRFRPALSSSGIIDHPYHFPPIQPLNPGPPVFGIFGNTGGGQLLEQVVRSVKQVDPSVSFRLIGFLSGPEPVERLRPLVEGVTDYPIPRSTFVERAREVTHALWLAPREASRLRPSGTFFDALAYGKPLIYTASTYVDAYHAAAPGIGIRCQSVEDVPAAILDVIQTHTPERYANAQAAIELLRRRFSPEAIAKSLPDALEW